MLVRHQPRLARLHIPQQRTQRLPGGSRTRSGSVLMNSPTIRSMPAISAGRPATVTPNTTSSRPGQATQQDRPRPLHHGVERQTLRPRLPLQCRGQRLG